MSFDPPTEDPTYSDICSEHGVNIWECGCKPSPTTSTVVADDLEEEDITF